LAIEASMTPTMESWAWVNVGLRPWFVEGAAPIAYEIAAGLGRTLPAHVVAPAASGSLACQLARGFEALATLGLVQPRSGGVRLSVTQASGCAPIAAAFADGSADVAPVRADTMALSLSMGDPPEGPEVLARVRATGGSVVAVDEDAIAAGVDLVRDTTGLEVEPACGVVTEGLRALAARGCTDEGPVVAVMTGGLARPPSLAVPMVPPVTIEPTLAALQDALLSREDFA
jgi:threonine synthase